MAETGKSCYEDPCRRKSPQGEIMGLAYRELLVYGVQFHPESILTRHGKLMLMNFLEL